MSKTFTTVLHKPLHVIPTFDIMTWLIVTFSSFDVEYAEESLSRHMSSTLN